jgi:hypothetical protein
MLVPVNPFGHVRTIAVGAPLITVVNETGTGTGATFASEVVVVVDALELIGVVLDVEAAVGRVELIFTFFFALSNYNKRKKRAKCEFDRISAVAVCAAEIHR